MSAACAGSRPGPLAPAAVGVGLRDPHLSQFAEEPVAVGFVEVHAENYFGREGLLAEVLAGVGERHAISLHGVAASLGSPDGLDSEHLERLAALVEDVKPVLISEHLAWSRWNGVYLSDLLPLPLTDEALAVVSDNVARMQDRLGRQLLVENPARYMRFDGATRSEPDFLSELVSRTGCALLLDLTNLFVSAHNTGLDALEYLRTFPREALAEIHLAGHERSRGSFELLIDSHSRAVSPAVWDLFSRAVQQFGPRPTLIEWDSEIPALPVLLAELRRAECELERARVAR
jgi:hypothetical protein